jgi:hypothetical protein
MRSTLSLVVGLLASLSNGACGQTPPGSQQPPDNASATSTRVLAVGDMAPAFSLPGSDGNQYSLASYRGRQHVVLAWFAKAFTEG